MSTSVIFFASPLIIKTLMAPILLENQFFISSTYDGDPVKNQIAAALVERIIMAARNGEKFKVG